MCFRRRIFAMLLLKLSVKAALWRSLTKPARISGQYQGTPARAPARWAAGRARQSCSVCTPLQLAKAAELCSLAAIPSPCWGVGKAPAKHSFGRNDRDPSKGQANLEAGSVARPGLPRNVSLMARPAPDYPKREWGGGLRFRV